MRIQNTTEPIINEKGYAIPRVLSAQDKKVFLSPQRFSDFDLHKIYEDFAYWLFYKYRNLYKK